MAEESTPVTPYWELHILPMFRLIDYDHMLSFRINLLDYADVVKHKDAIKEELMSNSMPPPSTGGPWPQEWIDLFIRWTKDCARLTSAKNVMYTLTAKGKAMSLVAQGTYGTKDSAWFERLPDQGGLRVYPLVVRPGGGSDTKPFKVEEKFVPAGTKSVTVIDGDGSHTVNA